MKMQLPFFAALMLIQSVTVAASATDVKNKAGETVDAAATYTKEQKNAFVKEMEKNLAAMKRKIREMKKNAGDSKETTLKKLEAEQKSLESNLAKMRKASGNAWDKLRDGVSKAWTDMKTSASEASDELKK